MQDFFRIILVFIILSPIFIAAAYSEGIIGRKILKKKELARKDAEITKIEPVKKGTKSSSHYEVIIHFSDGTSYRDKCNEEVSNGIYKEFWVSKEKLPGIIEDAINAHNDAVSGTKKRRFKEPTQKRKKSFARTMENAVLLILFLWVSLAVITLAFLCFVYYIH